MLLLLSWDIHYPGCTIISELQRDHQVQSKQAETVKVSLPNISLIAVLKLNRMDGNGCVFNLHHTRANLTCVAPEWAKAHSEKHLSWFGFTAERCHGLRYFKCCRCRNVAAGWLSANRLKPLLLMEGFKASPKLKSIQTRLSQDYGRHSWQPNTFAQTTG